MANVGFDVPFLRPTVGGIFACFSVDTNCLRSNRCPLPLLTITVAPARFGDGEQKSSSRGGKHCGSELTLSSSGSLSGGGTTDFSSPTPVSLSRCHGSVLSDIDLIKVQAVGSDEGF